VRVFQVGYDDCLWCVTNERQAGSPGDEVVYLADAIKELRTRGLNALADEWEKR
jgi:hypothetical protein